MKICGNSIDLHDDSFDDASVLRHESLGAVEVPVSRSQLFKSRGDALDRMIRRAARMSNDLTASTSSPIANAAPGSHLYIVTEQACGGGGGSPQSRPTRSPPTEKARVGGEKGGGGEQTHATIKRLIIGRETKAGDSPPTEQARVGGEKGGGG